MTNVDTPADVPEDPTKAELEALRAEKREREDADRAAKDDELEQLRHYKTESEAKAARAVPAPQKKADKVPAPEREPEPAAPVKKRSHVARSWFGTAAGDD